MVEVAFVITLLVIVIGLIVGLVWFYTNFKGLSDDFFKFILQAPGNVARGILG